MSHTNRGWSIPDRYLSKPWELDACARCGGPKTRRAAVCVACRRAIGKAKTPPAELFWRHVDKHGPVPAHDPTLGRCWLWTGARSTTRKGEAGYGNFAMDGRHVGAHRAAIVMSSGPIPAGLEPDHLCRNKGCVRRSHLELVTHRVNSLRAAAARRPG